MASQPSERPVGHMAAVCDIYSSDSPSSSGPPQLLLPPHHPLVCYGYASCIDAIERKAPLTLKEIILPEPPRPLTPSNTSTSPTAGDDLFCFVLKFDLDRLKRTSNLAATQPGSPKTKAHYFAWYDAKTPSQAHLQRSSPPLQPGEQSFPGKLPSFDEFVQTTIERTPPHTPSRRNESTENSPRVRPQFDDVAWSDTKRRRVDTLGDIYARPSNVAEYPPAESRRMSSAIDPALYHTDPARARQHSAGPSHHRPSLPYPSGASAPQHARHQSQPVAQGHSYQPPPMPAHRMAAQGSYAQPSPPSGMMYERRQSYYQDPHMQQHAYPYDDRRESVYYPNQQYAAQPPAGYEQNYYDVRFQQHVGVDHNAFNRKRRGNLPKEATNILKEWFSANRNSPYPTEDQKLDLCRMTNLTLNQVSNWFINARRRAPQKEQREREANAGTENFEKPSLTVVWILNWHMHQPVLGSIRCSETIDESATTWRLPLVKHPQEVALCSASATVQRTTIHGTHDTAGTVRRKISTLSKQQYRLYIAQAGTEFTLRPDYNALLSNDDARRYPVLAGVKVSAVKGWEFRCGRNIWQPLVYETIEPCRPNYTSLKRSAPGLAFADFHGLLRALAGSDVVVSCSVWVQGRWS
ncbi:hypothetical protein OPT61_g4268 [Boeremia exigua]|uniref:Uncharacterized protein n=1 Tax=Boeremia exigua TaxID=749465 RepID=A0ACC2IEQ6_9PLEO|nr:hypothetical protein OPT61_g4268 [Boeremia exigua]